MNKLKLNTGDLELIRLFENITGARVRDCIQKDDRHCYLVEEGQMGLAIGKNGANIKKVKEACKTEVIVIEHSPNEEELIKNIFHPVKIKKIQKTSDEDGKTRIKITVNKRDRGKVIGAGGYKIKLAREIGSRHQNIRDIELKIE